jgi:predicted nuclease of predicted toxin-antitoxin system
LKFLADIGVAERVVEWLRANGHDAVHLREQVLKRLPDSDIFEKASEEQRIILTFDLDFGEIIALSSTDTGGEFSAIISTGCLKSRKPRTARSGPWGTH